MKYTLTITPMQEKLPHLRCMFCIEGDDFYLTQYMEGTQENRDRFKKMLNALNS